MNRPTFVMSCSITRSVTVLLLLGTFSMLTRQAIAQVIFTEDFSGGNPAVSSDYTLVNEGVATNPGQYRIVANPNTAFLNNYAPFFDHTVGNSSGGMLFFDGPNSTRIWYRSATLTAGTQYAFSFWGASGSMQAPPTLQATLNGINVGSILTTTSATWAQSTFSFVAPTSGLSTFGIVDTNVNSVPGNDGAIDDVRLTVVVPESSCLVLLWSALPTTVMLVRRRINHADR